MIVHTDEDLVIGKRYNVGFISDADGVPHNIPFLVLREATKEEYLVFCTENSGNKPVDYENSRFYEVSVD